MTTTDTQAPAWLNLDAIHPPEERAKIPAVIDAARALLEAAVAFNLEHIVTISAYNKRNSSGPESLEDNELVDRITGMDEADDYLLLAARVITATVIGQGAITDEYAAKLQDRYAAIVGDVRGLYDDSLR